MKLLCLRGKPPWPTDTGANIRVYELFKRIARDFECQWIVHDDGGIDWSQLDSLGAWDSLPRMPLSTAAKAAFGLRHLFSPLPYTAHLSNTPAYRERVRVIAAEWQPDLIYTDTISVTGAVPGHIPFVMGTHNVEGEILARRAANSPIWTAPFWRYEARRVSRLELGAARRAVRVAAVSERDAGFFTRWIDREHVAVVKNGVDIDRLKPQQINRTTDLVFVGALDWFANREGLFWFFRTVWPKLIAARPDTTAAVVGRRPSPQLATFLQRLGPNVTCAFDVPDVEPYYHSSRIAVIPLLTGGGTRMKMVEAFAVGTPVVATSIGAEGVEAEPGADYIAADGPEAQANEIITLLADDTRREQIAARARQVAVERYGWDAAAADLLRLLEEAHRASR